MYQEISNHLVLIFYICAKSLPQPSGLKQSFIFLMNLWIRRLEQFWEGSSLMGTGWASQPKVASSLTCLLPCCCLVSLSMATLPPDLSVQLALVGAW